MKEVIELRKQIFSINYDNWTSEMLFSFKWWVLLILVIIFWFVWWKIADKERLIEIALVGFVTGLVSLILNNIGIDLTLWMFPNELFGAVKIVNVLDLTLIPITYMVLYQFFRTWKTYIISVVIFGLLGSFIGQPLFHFFNLYQPINWHYIYSFPIYLFMGIIIKFTASKIINIQRKFED